MDYVAILEGLDRRLHPRQRVGLRFYCWQIVNLARTFLSFWRHCYGCGAFKSCRCKSSELLVNEFMDARTAFGIALTIWRPTLDDRHRVRKPLPLRIVPHPEVLALAQRLQELDGSAEIGPWKAVVAPKYDGENWLLGSFGTDNESDLTVYLTTDGIHASECRGKGALADAEFCAEARNLMPQIIAALRWRAVNPASAEVTRV